MPDIDGALVDAQGKSAGQFTVVSTSVAKRTPDVAFGGKDYLVAWSQGKAIYGNTVSPTGKVASPVGTAIITSNRNLNWPALSFEGSGFLMAYWYDHPNSSFTHQVYARRVSVAGAPVGSAFPAAYAIYKYTNGPKPDRLGLAFDGLNHVIAWSNNYNVWTSRVSAGGKLLNSKDLVVSAAAGNQRHPAAASSGGETFMAWQDAQAGGQEINGTTMSKTGAIAKSSWVAVSSKNKCNPAIAFDGKHYLVVWTDDGCTSGDLRAVRVDTTGKAVDAASFAITGAGGPGEFYPAVAYGGGQFLVVWNDTRIAARWQIYGTRLRFGKAP